MRPGRVNVAVTAFWLKCDGSSAWLCCKLLERPQKRLLLDTVMQRARRIAEMRIERWLRIGVGGSCGQALQHLSSVIVKWSVGDTEIWSAKGF